MKRVFYKRMKMFDIEIKGKVYTFYKSGRYKVSGWHRDEYGLWKVDNNKIFFAFPSYPSGWEEWLLPGHNTVEETNNVRKMLIEKIKDAAVEMELFR